MISTFFRNLPSPLLKLALIKGRAMPVQQEGRSSLKARTPTHGFHA